MDLSTSSTYVGVNPGQAPHMLAYVAEGSPTGVTADTARWPQRPPQPPKDGTPLRCVDKSDRVARVIDHRYLSAFQLSTKGHLCLRSQELQGK